MSFANSLKMEESKICHLGKEYEAFGGDVNQGGSVMRSNNKTEESLKGWKLLDTSIFSRVFSKAFFFKVYNRETNF